MQVLAERFKTHGLNRNFQILQHDVNMPLITTYDLTLLSSAASNAYPQAFAVDPVGTITTNVLGYIISLNICYEKAMADFCTFRPVRFMVKGRI